MKKSLVKSILTLFLIAHTLSIKSQVSISGPTCALPNLVYHYQIKGGWKAGSTMQACVSGGSLKSGDSVLGPCTAKGGAPLSTLTIAWDRPGNGSISLNSDAGNSILQVTVVSGLKPGTIDTSSTIQMVDSGTIHRTIICSPDGGGSCSPVYSLQWQQSFDRVSWTDIKGAIDKDLVPKSPLAMTTFFRRKVTEKKSGTVAYSDVAAVFVNIAHN